jgi:hypothetical protein
VDWPAPFSPLDDPEQKAGLEDELRREVKPGHLLFGVPVRALGRRGDQDDVLFELLDGTGRVAEVHLSWAGEAERPPCPFTEIHSDFAAWVGSFNSRDDFEDMVALAAQDTRVTPARVVFQQARSGSYALLGAAALDAVIAAAMVLSPRVPGFETWRLACAVVYAAAACIFVGLFFLAQRDRLAAALCGLILYCLLIAPSLLVASDLLWLFQLIVLLALADGLRAARHQRRILQRALVNEKEAPG